MIHLKSFMESAGSMWRQVDRSEMEKRMRGHVVDTITKAEVQRVIDLLLESGRDMELNEYKMDVETLEISLFGEEAKDLRNHYPHLNKKNVWHPRTPANNLLIRSYMGIIAHFEVFKCDDDYFWVESGDKYFICDGIEGLLSMLAVYYTPEEK